MAGRYTKCLIALALILAFPSRVCAQQNYPGERVHIFFNVSANVELVASSNCLPYSRGCLGVVDTPFVASYFPSLEHLSDVRTNRGYSVYFPFTPCLLRLPYPKVERERVENAFPLSQDPDSPLYSHRVDLSDVYIVPSVSPNCQITQVDWESLVNAGRLPFANPLATHIRLGQFAAEMPGNPTAPYGYCSCYFSGNRFHEGFDSSWRTDPTANIIYSPIPISPIIVRGGWAMGIAPGCLRPAMMRADEEAVMEYLGAMGALESGNVPDGCDYAIVWGGFHVVSEFPEAPTGKAAIIMSQPANRGKTPWELGLIVFAGQPLAVCATVSGYAGDFTPHCHYQAAILPGSVARRWINELRENPNEYIRDINDLIRLRNRDWGGFWGEVYRYSVDPVIFLAPELTGQCLHSSSFAQCWKSHPWPEKWGAYVSSFTPSAYWDNQTQGEYLPGVYSPSGAIEQLAGQECKITNKDVPGCYCYPPTQNYYNTSNPDHSRGKVRAWENHVITVLQSFVCAKTLQCNW